MKRIFTKQYIVVALIAISVLAVILTLIMADSKSSIVLSVDATANSTEVVSEIFTKRMLGHIVVTVNSFEVNLCADEWVVPEDIDIVGFQLVSHTCNPNTNKGKAVGYAELTTKPILQQDGTLGLIQMIDYSGVGFAQFTPNSIEVIFPAGSALKLNTGESLYMHVWGCSKPAGQNTWEAEARVYYTRSE